MLEDYVALLERSHGKPKPGQQSQLTASGVIMYDAVEAFGKC